MEEMIRFVKRTYDSQMLSIEYQDVFNFKSEEGEAKALNLIEMSLYRPTDMDLRFADSVAHGFLEKMSVSWRSYFSSNSKVAWMKYYFVLRNDTIYLFEKDAYDKPFDSIQLEPYTLMSRSEESRKAKYGGKVWVLELARSEESPICLSCETEEEYKRWSECLNNSIEECRMNA